MRPRLYISVVVALVVLSLVMSCGPKKTPEQRLAELRMYHEIYPNAANTVYDTDGNPTLLVDLAVTNQGTVRLDHLTVLVRIRTVDGVEKVSQRVTLDLTNVRPGVGVQMAATLPGVELGENEELLVELESNLPSDVLHSLPEWTDVNAPD